MRLFGWITPPLKLSCSTGELMLSAPAEGPKLFAASTARNPAETNDRGCAAAPGYAAIHTVCDVTSLAALSQGRRNPDAGRKRQSGFVRTSIACQSSLRREFCVGSCGKRSQNEPPLVCLWGSESFERWRGAGKDACVTDADEDIRAPGNTTAAARLNARFLRRISL